VAAGTWASRSSVSPQREQRGSDGGAASCVAAGLWS
jgi:hypothetical protein